MGRYYVYRHWINRDYHPLFPTKNQYERQRWEYLSPIRCMGKGVGFGIQGLGRRGRLDCYRSIENTPIKENPENGKLHGTWGR